MENERTEGMKKISSSEITPEDVYLNRRGIVGDPETWKPPIVQFGSGGSRR